MKSIQILSLAVLLAGGASAARADLNYTFDADVQGFAANDVAAGELSWQPGGYLRIKDLTDATNVSLVFPAAATSGGWSVYQGGTLSFDARLESPIGSYWPDFGLMTLVSSQGSISLDLAPNNEPGLAWKTYSVKLDALTWGQDANAFASTLSNLQRVEISMEAGNGAIEIIHVDNISVTAVPEPASWALSLLGLALMGGCYARRKR
jgi:hypothetical protein